MTTAYSLIPHLTDQIPSPLDKGRLHWGSPLPNLPSPACKNGKTSFQEEGSSCIGPQLRRQSSFHHSLDPQQLWSFPAHPATGVGKWNPIVFPVSGNSS